MLNSSKRNMADTDESEPKEGTQPSKKAKSSETEEPENIADPDGGGDHEAIADAKWQLTKADIRERLDHLRKSASFADCVLLVGDGDIVETIQAHGMILCMSSPKFEEILVAHKQDGPIKIEGIEPRIFQLMLDYMYLDKVAIKSSEDACMLYKAAVEYEMPFLCETCAKFIVRDMTLETVWPVLKLVTETPEPALKEECGKFVRKNPTAILRHDNFPKVDRNVVSMLVDLDCMDVPELELLTAINKWSQERCVQVSIPPDRENKRAVIGPEILMKLRFLALSQEEFAREVAYTPDNTDSCILTLEESYAILMNLIRAGAYPMPLGFSSDRRPRKLSRLRCIRKVQQIPAHPPMSFGGFSTPPPSMFGSPYSTSDRIIALASPTQTSTLGGKNFSLDIKVDYPIMLYGIQVPTLWFPVQQMPKKPLPKDYDESFIITVLNTSGSPINHTVLSGKVQYGSSVDICLKEPLILEKNVAYKIQVYTTNTYFLSKKLNALEECPPVKFVFKDTAKVGNVPTAGPLFGGGSGIKQTETDFGFITQIIYSLWG